MPKDHPRVCGKDQESVGLKVNDKGSPPRVRERPSLTILDMPGIGITPACAGKTTPTTALRSFIRDHPRVCGKDSSEVEPSLFSTGSPPRVRERLVVGVASV